MLPYSPKVYGYLQFYTSTTEEYMYTVYSYNFSILKVRIKITKHIKIKSVALGILVIWILGVIMRVAGIRRGFFLILTEFSE